MRLFFLLLFIGIAYSTSYIAISPSEYQNDLLISTLQKYGVNFVIEELMLENKIPNKGFWIQTINNIYKMAMDPYFYYKYDLTYQNNENDTLDIRMAVRYNPFTQAMTVEFYTHDYNPSNDNNNFRTYGGSGRGGGVGTKRLRGAGGGDDS